MQPKRTWLPLLLGVLFCTFVGGGLRVLFAPDVVAKWVHDLAEKNQSRFFFQFHKAEISLASGWRPHFAIELTDVEFGAKDPCLSSSRLSTDRLIIPIKLSALIGEKVQFGHVQVGHLNVNLRNRDQVANCPPSMADHETSGDINDEIQNIEKFLATRWKKEINNTLRYLTEFSVQNLRLLLNDQIEPQFQLENVSLKFNQKSGEGHAEFIFWPGFYWSAGQPFGPTQIRIKVSEQDIRWEGQGNLKEGQIKFSGAWEIEKSVAASHLEWVDVPIVNLVALFDRWGLLNIQDFKPLHQWSTCTVITEGHVRDIKNFRFTLQKCNSQGDLGDYEFVADGLFLARGEAYPLTVKFSKANVKEVLDAFGFPEFKNLSTYGLAGGQLKWNEKAKWSADGEITGAEVFISLVDPSHRLEVGPAQFELNYKEGHFLGSVRSANSLGLGAQTQLQLEKAPSSDAVSMIFSLDIGENSGSFKKFNIFPYREMKLNLHAKTDYHDFYNVKGSIVLNEVIFNSKDMFYGVASQLAQRSGGEAAGGEIRVQKSESRFALLDNNNLFAEGRFEIDGAQKKLPFQYEVLLQDRKFESGKITSFIDGQRGAVFVLSGSLQEPHVQ